MKEIEGKIITYEAKISCRDFFIVWHFVSRLFISGQFVMTFYVKSDFRWIDKKESVKDNLMEQIMDWKINWEGTWDEKGAEQETRTAGNAAGKELQKGTQNGKKSHR